ncbi:MAG: hypothetical protein GY765_40675 [bacterium]|nr:hypothetical protein [bacterium]
MRRARITYDGAVHHVMNRRYGGNDIFQGDRNKRIFLDYLAEATQKLRIKIFAYCVMDTHYHLVLENSSGRMSEFMKRLNSLYGMYYRKATGGKGHVFLNRYKSTLVGDDTYLLQSIAYLLRNPVRAGIVANAEDYMWSSINAYFAPEKDEAGPIVDAGYVEKLYGTREEMLAAVRTLGVREPKVVLTKYGEVLGSADFLERTKEKFNRREEVPKENIGSQRKEDSSFEPESKVLWEFEKLEGVKLDEINVTTIRGKRQRARLLVLLKEKAGLTYKEIGEFEIFSDLEMNSLYQIYKNAKARSAD